MARVDLTGERATLLATLFARALDAGAPTPVPGDTIHPRLRCVTSLSAFDLEGYEALPMRYRVMVTVCRLLPAMKRTAAFYRLDF